VASQALTPQEFAEPSFEAGGPTGALCLALPNRQDSPAETAQGPSIHLVASSIALKLSNPKLPIVCWSRAIHATPVAVPETPVDKDDSLVFGQHDVWSPGQPLSIKPETIPHAVQKTPHYLLWRRIFPADAAHVPRAARFG